MKLRLLYIILSLSAWSSLHAQISLMPLLIYQRGTYCNYASPYGKTPYFKKQNVGASALTWGAFIKTVPITSKMYLYTGFYQGSMSFGYKIYNPSDGTTFSHGEGPFIFNFPVFVNLFDGGFSRKQKNEENISKRSIRFKLYAGLAYSYAPYDEAFLNSSKFSIGVGGAATPYPDYYVHLISTKGAAIMTGYSLYLYNNAKSKENISLNIFYFQGLLNLISTDVYYTANNVNHYAKLFSRGTSVDLVLAYNIRLDYKNWFKKKTE